jgi:6-phosphogluconolactonase
MNGLASPHVFRAFESRQLASGALAEKLHSELTGALNRHSGATLVVSGGTSPLELFHRLRSRDLDWKRVTVMPSDERAVPANHPDRNDAMIRRELLQDKASAARLLGLLKSNDRLDVGEEISSKSVPSRIDALVLGMGEDGHTASLFPDSPGIAEALMSRKPLLRLAVPRLKMERISLTPTALLAASRIQLLFFGQEKHQVFEAAAKPGPATSYPIRAVLHQERVPVQVFWAP